MRLALLDITRAAEVNPDPETLLLRKERQQALYAALRSLPFRHQFVIRRLLLGGETQVELAVLMGTTRQRVHHIVQTSAHRLRDLLRQG